jgi:hypothetical protein
MVFAAAIVARGGARIFIADENRAVDVVETPAEIMAAMKAAERGAPPRDAIEPRFFAFPTAHSIQRIH